MTITQIKENLSAQLHGGTLNKVRNIEALFERVSNKVLAHIDPLETMRIAPLTNVIHDDVYNYSLPSDFKALIDLMPQARRESHDSANRGYVESFDLQKELTNKKISIEGSEGSKIIRINWRSRQGVTLHSVNNIDNNGTWDAVGTATNIVQDEIYYQSGNGSVRFDIATSGDGINNDDMSAVDMTDEDEIGEIFFWMYFPAVTSLTSITAIWGNDLTTNYWTGVAQTTQADGTAFKVGWNLIKVPWSTATETGTVAPATIDSFRVICATTGAIADVRLDNIVFSVGRAFDLKYYSKFLIQNTSGTYITRTTSDDDVVVLDNDGINIFLLESLIAAAQQVEGADSTFDIGYAIKELHGDPSASDNSAKLGLYGKYRGEHPNQAKKAIAYYGSAPGRRRWPARSYYRRH
jgi:hypothetical protein|tara:strand:+ start:6903 stop:8126 length:1224 start_codon:yes stop_codon:yes gene_type:complete